MIFRGYFLKFFSFIRKNCKIMNASMKLKKVLKIKLISWIFLGSSLIFLILSAIFPKTRPILDDIRLFFSKIFIHRNRWISLPFKNQSPSHNFKTPLRKETHTWRSHFHFQYWLIREYFHQRKMETYCSLSLNA